MHAAQSIRVSRLTMSGVSIRWSLIGWRFGSSDRGATPFGTRSALPLAARSTPIDSADADLVARLRRGDANAFETVFHEYYRALCRFAEQYSASREDASDAVTNVLARLWQRRRELAIRGSLKTYLYSAVRLHALDTRKTHHRHARIVAAWATDAEPPGMGRTHDPDADVLAKEARTAVADAMRALPERCREIMRLRYEHDLPTGEIAEMLALAPKTVNNQLLRGLAALRAAAARTDTFGLGRPEV